MEENRPSPDTRAIILHPLVDLSHACPPVFVHYLKQVFVHGSGKSGAKFHVLRDQLIKSLPTALSPGPFTFVVKCLKALLLVEPPYNEGLSHMLLSALSRLRKSSAEDATVSREIAASLFYEAVKKNVNLETRILAKLPVVFGIQLKDIGEVANPHLCGDEEKIEAVKALLEPFLLDLIQTRSYTSAVSLLKQFDMQRSDSEDLLVTMASDGQADLAGQWAAHLGKDMLKFLIHRCTEMGKFKISYRLVQDYGLEKDFPDAHHLYRHSSIHKLVKKGAWDVAESIAEEDPRLVDYLLNLALEDGDYSKVMEVCERFQLDNVPLCPELNKNESESEFMQLESFISVEDLHWVDSTDGLSFAVKNLNGVHMVGIDCEWKADRFKGARPNKVSILQIASSNSVFVFDLISLSKADQNSLERCIEELFCAPNILKLGYGLHNDLKRLSSTYQELRCFQVCEPVFDMQSVLGKQAKGGLSGLSKAVLGRYVDKRTCFSDWECRPLSKRQLHYAALDAAILLPLFDQLCSSSLSLMPNACDWKTHLTSLKANANYTKQYNDACKSSVDDGSISPTTDILTKLACASHDDLVAASCELLGLPTPGLLKSELLEFTQAARLPPPVFNAVCAGPPNSAIYHCTVKVAGTTYSGCPAFSKKDAEFWAAQRALTSLYKGKFMCKGSSIVQFRDSAHYKSNDGRKFFVLSSSISHKRIESKLNIMCRYAAVTWSCFCCSKIIV